MNVDGLNVIFIYGENFMVKISRFVYYTEDKLKN